MKKTLVLLSLLAASFSALAAETGGGEGASAPSFALAGSVDPSAELAFENEDSAFAGLSDFSSESAAGRIDGKLSFSREYRSLGLLDFSFKDAARIGHEDGSTLESMSFAVNELYSDLNFGDLFYLRLGKQRLSWGAGYVFNPSDPVNPPKDPTSQRAVREGVPALKAEIIAKPVSLMAFAVVHDELGETGWGAKLSTSVLPNSDISVSGYESRSQSWTGALNASVAPFYELPGWDAVQLWFEGAVYGKGRYEAYAEGGLPGSAATAGPEGAQYAALVGSSAQLPVLRTIVLAEYYHLSEGLSASELGSVYKALRSSDPSLVGASSAWYSELARRPGRQASDYLFASISQPSVTESGEPFLDKLGFGLTCLVNLVDGSTYATAELSLAYVKDSSIDLSCSWARGSAYSEFGNAPAEATLGLEVEVFF